MQDIAGVLVNTVISAALYATMAYGLAVIYGVMRIINLAHAGLMMLGAYATLALFTRFALDPFLSLLVVGPLFFLFGVVLYRLVVRRLPRSGATPSCWQSRSATSREAHWMRWLVWMNARAGFWSCAISGD